MWSLGVIAIYTGDNCVFCDSVLETLREALSDFDQSMIGAQTTDSDKIYYEALPNVVGGFETEKIMDCS